MPHVKTRVLSGVRIPLTYRQSWDDGFGARGWKLDISLDDHEVIASTAETGTQIPTSVLIHDILDHYLCGRPLSGHRNEAVALIQLQKRTGSDPRPDFQQMVDEDLMRGIASGETLVSFLPANLRHLLPNGLDDGIATISYLKQKLGTDELRRTLVKRFFGIGRAGATAARTNYQNFGLDYHLRTETGMCLQWLLQQADGYVLKTDIKSLTAEIKLFAGQCSFHLHTLPSTLFSRQIA